MTPTDTEPQSNEQPANDLNVQPTKTQQTQDSPGVSASDPSEAELAAVARAEAEPDTAGQIALAKQSPESSVFGDMPADEPVEVGLTPLRPKRRLTKKLVALIASGVVVLLAGGTAAAFTFWYNKPEHVLDSMFGRVLSTNQGTADGSLVYKNDEQKSSFSVNYAFNANKEGEASLTSKWTVKPSADQKETSVNLDFVAAKDQKYYVKISPLKQIIDQLGAGEATMLDRLVTMIDGKWVVITPEDVQSDKEADAKAECAENELRAFTENKRQKKEVADVYKKNRFIVVSKDHGMERLDGKMVNHYELTVDDTKADLFADGLVATSIFKKVDDCYKGELKKSYDEQKKSKTTGTDSLSTKSDSATVTEVWIETLSHVPVKSKLSVTRAKEKSSLTMEANYKLNQSTKVTIPKADVTVDQLKTEIEKIQQELTGQYEVEYESASPVLGVQSDDSAFTSLFDTFVR